jgi:hypothetical protein
MAALCFLVPHANARPPQHRRIALPSAAARHHWRSRFKQRTAAAAFLGGSRCGQWQDHQRRSISESHAARVQGVLRAWVFIERSCAQRQTSGAAEQRGSFGGGGGQGQSASGAEEGHQGGTGPARRKGQAGRRSASILPGGGDLRRRRNARPGAWSRGWCRGERDGDLGDDIRGGATARYDGECSGDKLRGGRSEGGAGRARHDQGEPAAGGRELDRHQLRRCTLRKKSQCRAVGEQAQLFIGGASLEGLTKCVSGRVAAAYEGVFPPVPPPWPPVPPPCPRAGASSSSSSSSISCP